MRGTNETLSRWSWEEKKNDNDENERRQSYLREKTERKVWSAPTHFRMRHVNRCQKRLKKHQTLPMKAKLNKNSTFVSFLNVLSHFSIWMSMKIVGVPEAKGGRVGCAVCHRLFFFICRLAGGRRFLPGASLVQTEPCCHGKWSFSLFLSLRTSTDRSGLR